MAWGGVRASTSFTKATPPPGVSCRRGRGDTRPRPQPTRPVASPLGDASARIRAVSVARSALRASRWRRPVSQREVGEGVWSSCPMVELAVMRSAQGDARGRRVRIGVIERDEVMGDEASVGATSASVLDVPATPAVTLEHVASEARLRAAVPVVRPAGAVALMVGAAAVGRLAGRERGATVDADAGRHGRGSQPLALGPRSGGGDSQVVLRWRGRTRSAWPPRLRISASTSRARRSRCSRKRAAV